MTRKAIQKSVAGLSRRLIYQMGLDVAGRVKLYKDCSVEVYFYGRKEYIDQFKELLKNHSQFNGNDEWEQDGKVIYILVA